MSYAAPSFKDDQNPSTFSFKDEQYRGNSSIDQQQLSYKQQNQAKIHNTSYRSTNGFTEAMASTATNFRKSNEQFRPSHQLEIESLKKTIDDLCKDNQILNDDLEDYKETFDKTKDVIKRLK